LVASPRVLTILGMHRSGTSAFTRVASLLGAGLPSDLMPALDGINPTGFWESEAVAELNDELLAAAGRSWDDVRPIAPTCWDSKAARVLRSRAEELLRKELSRTRFLVLKDPRLCRTLPVWTAAIASAGASAGFVHVLRHPLEVAESIRARDGFGTAHSLLLWLRYQLDAEQATRSQPRSFATYEGLLHDWKQVALRTARELRFRWPRSVKLASDEIEAFLEASRRHHVFDASELSRLDVSPVVREAHETLLAEASGSAGSIGSRLDRCRDRLEVADGLYAELLADRDRQLASSRDLVAALDGHAAALTARAERAEEEVRHLAATLAAREAEVRRLEALAGARAAEIQKLEGRVASREFEIRRLERLAAGLEKRATAADQKLRQTSADQRAHLMTLLGVLDAAAG